LKKTLKKLKKGTLEIYKQSEKENLPLQLNVGKDKEIIEGDEMIECPICLNNLTKKKMKCMENSEYCQHFYCEDCMVQYLVELIMARHVKQLKCPFPTCAVIPKEDFLQVNLNEEMFRKYQEFSILLDLRNNINVRWCPIKTCSSAIVCEPEQIKNSSCVLCPECGHQFCFQCNEIYEVKSKCCKKKKKKKATREEKTFKQYLKDQKNLVKRCPKCGINIEKHGGCNHMICTNCHCNFSWRRTRLSTIAKGVVAAPFVIVGGVIFVGVCILSSPYLLYRTIRY